MTENRDLPLLDLDRLPAIRDSGRPVALPGFDPGRTQVGIVHFGIGAFHRAHQAVYTEDAMAATGDLRWGILGVTGRTDSVARRLAAQDGLYGLLVKDSGTADLRILGAVREAVWPGRDASRVVDALAADSTHVVTITVTEKGYHAGADRRADLADPAVVADLPLLAAAMAPGSPQTGSRGAAPAAPIALPQTPLGLLVAGLARRYQAGGRPISVVSCDNLRRNGELTQAALRSLLVAAAEADGRTADTALLDWLDTSVRFPSTMVDRITPATTAADRAEAEALAGVRDEALVITEPFSQWVVQDDFAGPRPAWEKAGATLTQDVAAYERMKLHILNGAHTALAYLGILRGHSTIAEAAADPVLRGAVLQMIDDDVIPTLAAPDGVSLPDYRDSVLHRFANPALRHTTRQIAMDGSQKMPIRILETASERIAAGQIPRGLAAATAAWMVYIAMTTRGNRTLDDPLAPALQAAVVSPDRLRDDPAEALGRLLDLVGERPDDPVRSSGFTEAVTRSVRELTV